MVLGKEEDSASVSVEDSGMLAILCSLLESTRASEVPAFPEHCE